MRSKGEQQNPLESLDYRDLRLMSEIYETPEVNQRQLSLTLGIALGLTNVLLKSLVQKGHIRVSNASWKRRLYNLTPEGLAHKLRLTTVYISKVLDHYQNIRHTLREQMEGLGVNQESRVAVCGTTEFTELVYLGLKELGIEEIDFYSKGDAVGERFLGVLVGDIKKIKFNDYDKVVIAELHGYEALSQTLSDLGVPEQKVVTFFPTKPCKNGSHYP
jgi:DNA-binding MarR family transcriptional regulator